MTVFDEYSVDLGGRQTPAFTLYRALRNVDQRAVLLKATQGDYPNPLALARLRHEYAMLRSLDLPEIVQAIALKKWGRGLGMILEDMGDRSLDTIISANTGEVKPLLKIAICLADALESVHRQRIVHKDLKPGNLYLSKDDKAVKVTGFEHATRLSHEAHSALARGGIDGTLAYMSPEQTGRMNRLVDRRSDLYSLGVTLYELLTGILPFTGTDDLELVHSHVARAPRPPREVRDTIPLVLSNIVLKLLAKAAEDRYQDAGGLKADLQECLAQLEGGQVSTEFSLGRWDVSDELRIPQQLYGRDRELGELLSTFHRVRAGAAELLLIRGNSGVGKSVLIHELGKQLVREGQLVSGKFDQLDRDRPYAPIVEACRALVQSVLTQSGEPLTAWKGKLLKALGSNGRLLIDLLPELETVIGPQPLVLPLAPADAQRRFESTFQHFLQAFASAEHPLVFFLDDLQWADAASLRLVQRLFTDAARGYLLVIGAYRENEVGQFHPLMLALDDLRNAGATISEVQVSPLDLPTVSQLLVDTLGGEALALQPLAELMLRKTRGNPFFINQFLMSLHRQELLAFDPSSKAWTWDLARIEATGVTDNVIEFMLEQFRRLPTRTQQLLRLAACVGHRFDGKMLSVIARRSQSEVAKDMGDALRAGLVVPLDENYRFTEQESSDELNPTYRFLHDRVQQAAYALIDDADRQSVHLQIGRLLLTSFGGVPANDALFEVVNHMNHGVALLADPSERGALARLNLIAGRRARDAVAHSAGAKLLATTLALLGDDGWRADYGTTLAAHLIKAECDFVCGRIDEGFKLLDAVDHHAASLLDRVAGRVLRIVVLTNLNRLADATACGAAAARLLGVDIPTDPAAFGPAIGAAFQVLIPVLTAPDMESRFDLPVMTRPEMLATLDVLCKTCPAAYMANPETAALLVLKAVSLSLEHGHAPSSAYFYIMGAQVFSRATGDRAASYRIGKMGIELSARPEFCAFEGASHFVFGLFLSHWRRHLDETVEHFRQGLRASLETADYLHIGYCGSMGIYHRFFKGESLEVIAADLPALAELLTASGDVINSDLLLMLRQVVASLRGQTHALGVLDDAGFVEKEYRKAAERTGWTMANYLIGKSMMLYLAGDYAGALGAASEADGVAANSQGFFLQVEHVFYRALALAELLKTAEPEQRASFLGTLRESEETLRGWADGSPANHAYRHALIAAEIAAATGANDEAIEHYDRAIASARQDGAVQHQALAFELCGQFFVRRGRARVAHAYLVEAHDTYLQWGAKAKAQDLVRRHPELRALVVSDGLRPEVAVTADTSGLAARLDLMTAMRATQALASELVPARLIERLMRSLIEHAGAQRAFLVMARGAELKIVAAATVDPDAVRLGLTEGVQDSTELAASVVNYVAQTEELVVLDVAAEDPRFRNDPYIARAGVQSLLCLGMFHQGRVVGVLYLENNSSKNAFHPGRVELLQFLASQAAVALENATLYGDLQTASAELKTTNESLEIRVQERTKELGDRNRDMRLVLDHVDQGFLTLDRAGRLAQERSAIVDRWFGPYGGQPTLVDYLSPIDPRFSGAFEMAFEALIENVLPQEVCLEQMPARLRVNGSEWTCTYRPIVNADSLDGLLMVIKDVTLELRFEAEAAEHAEFVTLIQGLTRDRDGCLGFWDEATHILARLVDKELEVTVRKRLLHTLKGTSAMFGLSVIAKLCHAAENELFETGAVTAATDQQLRGRWSVLKQMLDTMLGDRDAIEISSADFDALGREISSGTPSSVLLARLGSLRWELAERPLKRLGRTAQVLAKRLGKSEVVLVIDAPAGLRLDPTRWNPIWSVMVHVVRNAVDHGVEAPDEREAAGKANRSCLRLAITASADRLVLEVQDDGRGIDWAAVKSLAAERGLTHETQLDLVRALLSSDFSTRGEATETSGRGVGMAAVRDQIETLGGEITVHSRLGHGCCWRFSFAASGESGPAPTTTFAGA